MRNLHSEGAGIKRQKGKAGEEIKRGDEARRSGGEARLRMRSLRRLMKPAHSSIWQLPAFLPRATFSDAEVQLRVYSSPTSAERALLTRGARACFAFFRAGPATPALYPRVLVFFTLVGIQRPFEALARLFFGQLLLRAAPAEGISIEFR